MSSTVLPIAEADICIFQGATFSQTLFWEVGDPSAPVNLTGYTAKLQVRKSPTSKAVLIELSTSNGGITLGGATGSITLSISATNTAQLQTCEEKAVYDLKLTETSSGIVSRILQGNVIISPQVTK